MKLYKDGQSWLGDSSSPDYKVLGMTWEILLERLQEASNMIPIQLNQIPGIQKRRQ